MSCRVRCNLRVIHEFSCDHDTGNKKAMDVERIQTQVCSMNESVQVYMCNDEARRTAVRIPKNPINVLLNAQRRRSGAMEYSDNIFGF